MEKRINFKKLALIVAIIAAATALLIADGKMGESVCEGEGKYNQTTGKCIGQ